MDYFELKLRIPKQPWRWIRFRIVTLLLVTAIVCILLAWRNDHQRLTAEIYALRNPGPHWDTDQVTGPPDTHEAGDIRTAWAAKTPDANQEWLVLEYEQSVVPIAVLVHETYNPGAVVKLTRFEKFGGEETLWEGADPTPAGAELGVSRLPVSTSIATNRIKLYIDSPAVPGWNEIDAVGLVYGNEQVIWAERAYASSSYGRNNPLPVFVSGAEFFR
jgi:hypothetical protein